MNRTVVLIVLGLIALGVILYFILRPRVISTTTNKNGPFNLSVTTNALNASDFASTTVANAFANDGQGTFQCFVLIDALSRTGGHVDCGVGSNKPDCDSGLYNICTCNATSDCTNCTHDGYQPVFTIHGIYTLEVMNAPDASRPNGVATQLTVRTRTDRGGNPATQVETITLPPIDHQKWVMITIAREGRRIDVYYNNTLVTSSNLNNVVSTISNGTPLITGNYMLSGKIGGLTFLPNRMSVQDVSSVYGKATNTRGDPLIFTTTPNAFAYDVIAAPSSSIAERLCLDGSCLSFPQLGQPDISSYPNIFNIKTSVSGVPFTTQYA
uniref:Lectin/glucanase superfamily protein n=1 Tax=viral metagenome TaxID=1070528 RepID=A0A6C0JV00_9ZZZZ